MLQSKATIPYWCWWHKLLHGLSNWITHYFSQQIRLWIWPSNQYWSVHHNGQSFWEKQKESSQCVWTLIWKRHLKLFINAAHRCRPGFVCVRAYVSAHCVCPSQRWWEWIAATRGPVWWRGASGGKERKDEDKRRNGNLSLHHDLSYPAFLCSFPLTAAARSYICAPAC